MSATDHFVQFYETDSFLLESLDSYVGEGLAEGDACIVVAAEGHRRGLERKLSARGLDVDDAKARGRYVALDAAETLSKFMVGGEPERDRFAEVVGGVVSRASAGVRGVRVFGDMVAHLCDEGKHEAAIRLEELWNDLGKEHRFSLFCAYPLKNFGTTELAGPFGGICATHTRVIPAENYTAVADTDERLRAVVRLQQQARLLEAEIAERKRAETELRALKEELEVQLAREKAARAEAEAANRLKDEFLATVSHELRTPLTAILGWTHMLRTGQLDERASDAALATVERNARAQTQIVEDLLDVSRIISGKLRLDVRPTNPSSFIEAAIESVLPAAEAKGVRVRKIIDSGVGAVAGDPERLQQIVWNLLSNAIKFTPRGGRVQVKVERVNSHIEIVVSDNGAGIRREFLPFVFDRFRQADMSTTRAHGGLGLGLAIVRHLAELHGGSARAESEGEGRGATFAVSLPLVSVYLREAAAEEAANAPADDGAHECSERLDGVKVLVVDDEADTRELVKTMLGQRGADVTTASSASEALELLERSRPDVLVSDIGMSGEDGYSLIRKVRKLPKERGGRTPAVALTAYARAQDRARAIKAGYQLHVPKPVELNELVTFVASLVERRAET